jgi:hypothetical protein
MANMTTTVMVPNNFQPSAKTEMDQLEAMRTALLAYNQPLTFPSRTCYHPHGMLCVIKTAAGDNTTIETMVETLRVDARTLQEAASFYLQQQHFRNSKSPFQQLGLSELATLEDIALHKRWLLKWLHPDRNPNKWQSTMFHDVTAAAHRANALVVPETQRREDNSVSQMRNDSRPHNRNRSVLTRPRKPIRMILWREVFWRITRKLATVSILVSLLYLGVSHIIDPTKQWTLQTYFGWLQ